jgi:hypothetical protein
MRVLRVRMEGRRLESLKDLNKIRLERVVQKEWMKDAPLTKISAMYKERKPGFGSITDVEKELGAV